MTAALIAPEVYVAWVVEGPDGRSPHFNTLSSFEQISRGYELVGCQVVDKLEGSMRDADMAYLRFRDASGLQPVVE